MKSFSSRLLQIFALIAAFAMTGFAEESRRGFFTADLSGGGKILFFVENNHGIAAYVFNQPFGEVSVGSATIAGNGSFSMTTTEGETITGTVSPNSVTAIFRGATITANAADLFGDTAVIAGKYKGFADAENHSDRFELTLLIDGQGHVFAIGKRGSDFFGGFGTVTIEPDDDGDDNADKDEDERHDGDKHRNQRKFKGKFTVTFAFGEVTFTGSFKFNHGTLKGDFSFQGVKFRFRVHRDSADNHLGNLSTRAYVNNTPQGQMIAGFIITGGPKLVLIRALGPSLSSQGVTEPVLADPVVRLFRGSTQLAENDNWQTSSNASNIIATTIPPQNGKEAAILVRLEAGTYTAVVSDAAGGTGIGLLEVYEINVD
jgi:hypothetical protein